MERCVICGEEAKTTVHAVYADDAFEEKRQRGLLGVMPMHRRCYQQNRVATTTTWEPIPGWEPGDGGWGIHLVEREHERLWLVDEQEATSG